MRNVGAIIDLFADRLSARLGASGDRNATTKCAYTFQSANVRTWAYSPDDSLAVVPCDRFSTATGSCG